MTGTSTDNVRTELVLLISEQGDPRRLFSAKELVTALFQSIVALRIVSGATEFGVFSVPRAT